MRLPSLWLRRLFFAEGARPIACDQTLDIDINIDIDTKHPAKSGDKKIM